MQTLLKRNFMRESSAEFTRLITSAVLLLKSTQQTSKLSYRLQFAANPQNTTLCVVAVRLSLPLFSYRFLTEEWKSKDTISYNCQYRTLNCRVLHGKEITARSHNAIQHSAYNNW